MEHVIQSKNTKNVVQKKRAFFAPAFVQPKLTIGAPNDVYEQEADSIADKVMRMSDGQQLQSSPSSVNVQRKCAHCDEEEKLQRKPGTIIQRDTPDNDSGTGIGNQTKPYLHLSITMPASDPQSDIDNKINYGEANIQLIERGINMPADYTIDYSNLWKADYELSKGLRLGTMIKNLYGIGERFDAKALRPVRGVVKKIPLVGGLLKSAIKFEAPKVEGNDWDKYAADKMALGALGNSLNRDNPAYNDVSGHTITFNIIDTNFEENNISKLFRKPASVIDDGVIQKKCCTCEEDEMINKKENTGNTSASTQHVEQALQSPGQSMDLATKSFMEDRFGYDFSKVQIHNDALAHRSSKDINALAYTNENHIVFGAGQYQPNTFSGKQLLAHELTHVVQQKNSNQTIQRRPTTTTPTPTGGTNLRQGGFELNIDYIKITGLPDVYNSPKEKPHQAHTYLLKPVISPTGLSYAKDPATGLVSSFTPYQPFQINLTIETNYASGVVPSGTSDYGYGTRPEDKKAKNTSIQFHEGSHGSLFIQYIQKEIKKYPSPQFEGKEKMTVDEFLKKNDEYLDKVQAINQMILAAINYATITVDCAGVSIDKHNAGKRGYVNICP